MHASKLVHNYLQAWNHYDADGVAAFLTRNGIYFDRPHDARYSRPALAEYLYDLFAREKHQYQLVGDILVGERSVAFQYCAADPEHPDGPAEYGAEFLSLRGDKITHIEVYYSPHNEARETNRAGFGKYVKSGLDRSLIERYKTRLQHLMDRDRLYLSSDLSLPKLALAMNCSVNHLSQVINAGMGTNFYDFINRYRIAEAKRLLVQEPVGRGFVLGIATQVGFNSNSAFYTAFKKACQQTPLEFRRDRLNRQA